MMADGGYAISIEHMFSTVKRVRPASQRYNRRMDWRERFDAELEHAAKARARGNEGQARVCARRAAGIVATEYYARRNLVAMSASAVDVLLQLKDETSLPPDMLPLIEHLMQRVNTEFHLPSGVDLIEDVQRLRLGLLPG